MEKKEYKEEKTEVIKNISDFKESEKKKRDEIKDKKEKVINDNKIVKDETKKKKIKINKEKIKEFFKILLEYIKAHKILTIINVVMFILVILGFTKKVLLGFVLILLWLIGIVIYTKFGGIMKKKLKKDKKDNSKTSNLSKTQTFKKDETKPISKAELKKKKRKRFRRKFLKFIFNFILIMILFALIGGIVFSIYIVINAPEFNPENLYRAESSIIYDRNGNQIQKLGVEKRKKITYEQLPQVLIDAIVATEDSRYYQHNGFDLPRFTKAAFGQVVSKITHRGNPGGGSTISMQVVKNNFTDTEQTITRKFTDIYISIFKLEKNYTKEQILEYYVNTPFLGNGSYGVEQACQSYFGKSVTDINLSEAAIIAGLFQAPSSYDPYMYPENTEERRATVLYLMKMHGYITAEEQKLANSIPVTSLLRKSNPEATDNEFQSFIDIVIDEVEQKTGKSPYTTGMKIYTTLDPGRQRVLNDVMAGRTWEWKDEYIQAGIGVVGTQTGEILAIGGGRGRTGERQYNYATMIKKQIGSTAKPLFDYGPAIEYNNFCLSTPFNDDTYTYTGGGTIHNWDYNFEGVITLKLALAESRNIPAVKAFQSVENSKIKEFVTNLGMTPEIDSEGKLHEAHALGGFSGTNPVQLAGAYAAFGNGGYFIKPYSVTKVEYIDSGKTVSLKSKKKRAMSEATAYMITNTLLYAVESYGNIGGTVWGVDLAAKTGTTNLDSETIAYYGYPSYAVNDMWDVGYTPEVTVSLWYGYDKLLPGYYNVNGVEKNILYRQVVDAMVDRNVNQAFSIPDSVVSVTVEKETYPVALPSANTPDDMKVTDYCKAGTAPTTVSPRYNKLDNVTGLNITEDSSDVTISWKAAAQPKTTSFDYFKEYYKVLYAQHIEPKFAEMQAANGPFGYEVIGVDDNTGAIVLDKFTTSTSMTVPKPAYPTTYTVKTKYQNNNITISTGVSKGVNGDKSLLDENDFKITGPENTTVTLSDGSAKVNVGNIIVYDDDSHSHILGENEGITVDSPVCRDSSGNEITIDSDNTVTFTSAGTYKINWRVYYNNSELGIWQQVITVN